MNTVDLSTQKSLMEMALTSENGLEKLQALIALQHAEEARRAKKEFDSAMSAMQGVMPVIKKKKVNSFNKSKFASLDDIVLEVQPVLAQFGFSYKFEQEYSQQGNNIRVTCVVTHVGGHSERSMVQAPADAVGSQGNTNKNPIQANNSTVTYLRRYAFTGAFGLAVADEDIDGRIEGVTQRQLSASKALSAKLDTPMLTFEEVEANLYASQTLDELYSSGRDIPSITVPNQQAALKQLYFKQKEAIEHGQGN